MKFLLDRQNFDACPEYNSWLDEQHVEESGALEILGFRPRPSFVLFSLSQDTYRAAFGDFQQQREEEIKQNVIDDFPSPIAHYFYRFENGYENELQRLHFLRDTWEAIVDVLHAIAVSECRFRKIPLGNPVSISDFFSEKVAQRILNIERIVNYASSHGISLIASHLANATTLEMMRELNQSRNGFSHSAAQSELQAQTWIAECYADVIAILDDLQRLSDIEILRYMGQADGSTLRCEVFKSHAFTRTIRNVSLTADQVRDSQRYFQQGQVIVSNDESFFSIRPWGVFFYVISPKT
jgi:hypothetical protein